MSDPPQRKTYFLLRIRFIREETDLYTGKEVRCKLHRQSTISISIPLVKDVPRRGTKSGRPSCSPAGSSFQSPARHKRCWNNVEYEEKKRERSREKSNHRPKSKEHTHDPTRQQSSPMGCVTHLHLHINHRLKAQHQTPPPPKKTHYNTKKGCVSELDRRNDTKGNSKRGSSKRGKQRDQSKKMSK